MSAMTGDTVVLRDGSTVLIRAVEPEDAGLLADGFASLSAESRQMRFLTGKAKLTPAELRYLTEIDHHDHEAIGAMDPGNRRGLGVARYIRSAADRTGAEVAVTVIDEWQGRGLAAELLSRLADRAREEGIDHFTALVGDDNAAVLGLLEESRLGDRATDVGFGAVEFEITLPPRGLGDDLQALLRALGHRQVTP